MSGASWLHNLKQLHSVPSEFIGSYSAKFSRTRCVVAQSAVTNWSISTAEFTAALRNAHLVGQDDDIYIVQPPLCVVELGLEESNVYWD